MSATMTPKLSRAMRSRPLTERIHLWWLLRRLSSLDRQLKNSFVGDAGFALSNYMNGGYSNRIQAKIAKVEAQIAEITVPAMRGL